MPLLASYIFPHSPVIVPEIGKGQEKELEATLDSCRKIAKEIASLHPDTIVIASPHAESYSDYFQLSSGETATGSLKAYGAPQIRFRLHYDDELRKEITRLSFVNAIKAGYDDSEDPSLDHGTMVPLYFINKEYKNYQVVRLGLTGLPLLSHYRMGAVIAEAAKKTGMRIVFIASGDMSHCLSKEGVYGYREEAAKYESQLNKSLKNANFGDLLRMDSKLISRAKECGNRAFAILSGTLDRLAVETTFYSHEAPFGTGHGVYGYMVKGPDDSRAFGDYYISKILFSLKEKQENCDDAVKLAYMAVNQAVKGGSPSKVEVPSSYLEKKEGVIVSIYEFGALRARFGSIVPQQSSFAQEIISNSVKATKDDTFFDAISEKELPYLDIVVTEVSDVKPLKNESDFDAEANGIYVKKGNKSGYSLPFDSLGFDYRKQLRIAKREASLKEEESATVYRFSFTQHK